MSRIVPSVARRAARAAAVAGTALVLLPTAAHAEPTPTFATQILSPAPESVLFAKTLAGELMPPSGANTKETWTVSGVAPDARDGATLDVLCVYTMSGTTFFQVLASNVSVAGGRFSVEASIPSITCRMLAVPANAYNSDGYELNGVDLAPYVGPRVLGGITNVDEHVGPRDGQVFTASHGQAQGAAFQASLAATGAFGVGAVALHRVEGVDYRPLFANSADLGYRSDLRTRPTIAGGRLVIDGTTGLPAASSIGGTDDSLTRVVSERTNPATGDSTIVERVPIDLVDQDLAVLYFSGVVIERTSVQDQDGRRLSYRDVFRAVDGRAHRLEATYAEGVSELSTDDATAPAYRLPGASSDDYVTPAAGTAITAPSAGPMTIGVRGRAAGAGAVAPEGTLEFDAAPTDGTFQSADRLLVRFVREIPAGGTTAIGQRLTIANGASAEQPAEPQQPATPEPAAPLEPSTPLPVSAPAPQAPSPLTTPLPREDIALARLIGIRTQVARLRRTGRARLTLGNAPAGRYSVRVRRSVRSGPAILTGTASRASTGTLRMSLRLTSFGKRYVALKHARRRTSVMVRTQVTWTPVDGAQQVSNGRSSMRFR